MGDYSGLEFDTSVESDVDMANCDHAKVCLHSQSAAIPTRWSGV